MKNVKWTANELFDMFTKECNNEEFYELYKALIARELDVKEYDDKLDKVLNEALKKYYINNDIITSFINPDLIEQINEY